MNDYHSPCMFPYETEVCVMCLCSSYWCYYLRLEKSFDERWKLIYDDVQFTISDVYLKIHNSGKTGKASIYTNDISIWFSKFFANFCKKF